MKRNERLLQMSKQEELIAKKREELLIKKKTAELGKFVAAAQISNSKKDLPETSASENEIDVKLNIPPVLELHPTNNTDNQIIKNSFCNDGSFLEHFKKILEANKIDMKSNNTEIDKDITNDETEPNENASDQLSNNEYEIDEAIKNFKPPESSADVQIESEEQYIDSNNYKCNIDNSNFMPEPLQKNENQFEEKSFSSNFQQQPQQINFNQQSHFPPQFLSNPSFHQEHIFQSIPPVQYPSFTTNHQIINLPTSSQIPSSLPSPAQNQKLPFNLNLIPPLMTVQTVPSAQQNLISMQPKSIPTLSTIEESNIQLSNTNANCNENSINPHLNFENTSLNLSSGASKDTDLRFEHFSPSSESQSQRNINEFGNMDSSNSSSNKEDHKCSNDNLPISKDKLIEMVLEKGDKYEDNLRLNNTKNELNPELWFLFETDSSEYIAYRQTLQRMREQKQKRDAIYNNDDKYDPESVCSNDSDDEYNRNMLHRNTNNLKRRIESREEIEEEERIEKEARKRKSRWGEKIPDLPTITTVVQSTFANQNKPILSAIQRTDPALLQYARMNYGSTNLTEEDWRKCEEHFKINILYQDMMKKRKEIDQLARSGKFKYEYDSDEDTTGGTWEHKLRSAEMEATARWATALTKQSEGRHHIGDFLPPEELKKFMEQYDAKKNNREPDLSDYKEFKLKQDNKGFQMLQKLGWQEGQGLGAGGDGIVDPVNKAPQREGNQGLGVTSTSTPDDCDNEYEAYRKRMMLAYRFRPNPLNNPRRAYY